MNVVAEYIMDFLVKSSDASHNLISEINNKDARVSIRETNRSSGYYCGYSSMGSSCAMVPYREINTYVISNLFAKFSQIFNERGTDVPSAKDCFNVLKAAFAPNANTFEDISKAVYVKAASGLNTGIYTPYPDSLTDINWDDVVTDEDKLKELRADIMVPKMLHDWYHKQYSDKIGVIEKNRASLSNAFNTDSLIGLIRSQLDIIVRDIYRGPSFALRSIDAAEKDSIEDVVKGLIATNTTNYNNAVANLTLRATEYNECVKVIKKRNASGRRGKNAQNALISFFNQLGTIALYESLIKVLTTLKEQLVEAKSYYSRLETVYNELKARFDSNVRVIEATNSTVVDISYADYLVTITQLRNALDRELALAVPNIPNTFDSFMAWITDPKKRHLLLPDYEDEFVKYVNSFFIDDDYGLFNGLVKMTIDDYLRMAYAFDYSVADWHNVTNNQVQDYVVQKITNLLSRAQPLFGLNIGIQDNLGRPTGWITIPAGSGAIAAAATEANTATNLIISKSDLSDRIFVEMRHDGVSLSAMNRVSGMEDVADQVSNRHLYSGYPKQQGFFNDWGKLPPLTPYQKWNHFNHEFTKVDGDAKAFDEALDCMLLQPARDDSGSRDNDFSNGIIIREFNEEAIRTLDADITALKNKIGELSSTDFGKKKIELYDELNALKNRQNLLFTEGFVYRMSFNTQSPDISDPTGVEHQKAFYRDMLVRSPQIILHLRQQLSCSGAYYNVVKKLDDCQRFMKEKDEDDIVNSKALPIFEFALYTGLFTINGNNITCSCKDSRTGRDLVSEPLTDASRREEFPFFNIPIYQAFLTFKTLDSATIDKIGALADEKANDMFNPGSAIDPDIENFMRRMSVWYKLAEKKEDSRKIVDFLENEHEQFAMFKEERGL